MNKYISYNLLFGEYNVSMRRSVICLKIEQFFLAGPMLLQTSSSFEKKGIDKIMPAQPVSS